MYKRKSLVFLIIWLRAVLIWKRVFYKPQLSTMSAGNWESVWKLYKQLFLIIFHYCEQFHNLLLLPLYGRSQMLINLVYTLCEASSYHIIKHMEFISQPLRCLISNAQIVSDHWLLDKNEHLSTLASSTAVPTVYICKNFACSLPITSLDALKEGLFSF